MIINGELHKITMSLCPVCYGNIPATISVERDGVWMTKTCQKHGTFKALVERDIRWYDRCSKIGHTNIYNGYFVDITDKCNIQCKYCYHPNNKTKVDRSVSDITGEIWKVKNLSPFFITGGEPTLHEDIVNVLSKVSKVGETFMLTNGIKLVEDGDLLSKVINTGVKIVLSFHKESMGKDTEFLKEMRNRKEKVESSMWVIDSMNQMDEAIEIYKEWKDVLKDMRIKAASNLWNEHKVKSPIMISDMLNYLSQKGEVEWVNNEANKVSYAPITFNKDLNIKLVSWYTVDNIDLWDIMCPPLYKANDGTVNNFVTTCIINEGIRDLAKIRVRRGYKCDVLELSKMWVKLVQEIHTDHSGINIEWWVNSTIKLLDNPEYHLTVAEDKGKLIGFMDGVFAPDPMIGEVVAHGRHMYVVPEYRDKNVAGLMHKRVVGLLKDRGVNIHRYRVLSDDDNNVWKDKGYKPVESVYEKDRRDKK